MAVVAYNAGLLALLNGSIAFGSDACYAVLLTDSYTPSAAHDTYSDVSAVECADGDYDQVALTTKTVALNGTAVDFDSDDIDFGSAVTITARYIAILKGTAASPQGTDPLIWYNDFGSNKSSTNAQFIVRTTNKIYTVTPS